jgi:hypothetical protein
MHVVSMQGCLTARGWCWCWCWVLLQAGIVWGWGPCTEQQQVERACVAWLLLA